MDNPDGLLGLREHHLHENDSALLHTEVDPRFQGEGVGGTLVRGVLDAARRRGLARQRPRFDL